MVNDINNYHKLVYKNSVFYILKFILIIHLYVPARGIHDMTMRIFVYISWKPRSVIAEYMWMDNLYKL